MLGFAVLWGFDQEQLGDEALGPVLEDPGRVAVVPVGLVERHGVLDEGQEVAAGPVAGLGVQVDE